MKRKGTSQTVFKGCMEDGELVEFKIVTVISDYKTDKNYVVYTENDEIPLTDKSLYAAEYIPDEPDYEGGTRLYRIEDENALMLVTTVVKGMADQEENMTEECGSCGGSCH